MSNIVITGATGFIGRNLTSFLKGKGHKILGLGRDSTDYSFEDLQDKFQNYEILIHLAGKRLTRNEEMQAVAPFANDAINILDNILKAAKENNFKKVITASSIGVYSLKNNTPFLESEEPKPANPYGMTKLISEQITDMWGRNNNIKTAHLRLAACYGYGEKDTPALMKFVKQARDREVIKLSNGGTYQIDQIYIKDAILAFEKLVNGDASGAFNIGSGTGYSIKEIAKTINEVFDNQNNIEIDPIISKSKDETMRHMNIDKAQKELDWQPEHSLKQGIKDMKQEIENEEY